MLKEMATEITSMEMFEKAYTSEQVSVFIFSADWCPDCHFMEPFMPKLIATYTEYNFYYIDRDKWMEICQRMMVMGIPSFVAVRNGKEIDRFVSKLRKTEVEINSYLKALA